MPPAAQECGGASRPLRSESGGVFLYLANVAGLALGQIAPGLAGFLARLKYGSVNFVVAILIGAMVYPMMAAADFRALTRVHKRPKGLIVTLAVTG